MWPTLHREGRVDYASTPALERHSRQLYARPRVGASQLNTALFVRVNTTTTANPPSPSTCELRLFRPATTSRTALRLALAHVDWSETSAGARAAATCGRCGMCVRKPTNGRGGALRAELSLVERRAAVVGGTHPQNGGVLDFNRTAVSFISAPVS